MHLTTPTPAQYDQAAIAQHEILEAMSCLNREGMDWRVVLTGAIAAIAEVVSSNVNDAEVPVYFAQASAMSMHLAQPGR